MVLVNEIVGLQVVPRDPLIVRVIVALPFDKVLVATIANARVQHLLYLKVLFSINQRRIRWTFLLATWEWVLRHWKELDDWKHRVKASKQWRKFHSICARSNSFQYLEWTKAKRNEFLTWAVQTDVGGVNKDLITGLELGCRLASTIVVACIFVLRSGQCVKDTLIGNKKRYLTSRDEVPSRTRDWISLGSNEKPMKRE